MKTVIFTCSTVFTLLHFVWEAEIDPPPNYAFIKRKLSLSTYKNKVQRSTPYAFDMYTTEDIPNITVSYSDNKGLTVFIPARPWYKKVFVNGFFKRAVDFNPYDYPNDQYVTFHKILDKPNPEGEWVAYINDYPVESGDSGFVYTTIQPRQDYVISDYGVEFNFTDLPNGTLTVSAKLAVTIKKHTSKEVEEFMKKIEIARRPWDYLK